MTHDERVEIWKSIAGALRPEVDRKRLNELFDEAAKDPWLIMYVVPMRSHLAKGHLRTLAEEYNYASGRLTRREDEGEEDPPLPDY